MDFPVLLNGEQENRRGKKLYDHDEIIVGDENFYYCTSNADELIGVAAQEEAYLQQQLKTVRDDRIKAQKQQRLKYVKRRVLLNYGVKIGRAQVALVVKLLRVVIINDPTPTRFLELTSLKLVNYRNYANLELDFSPGVNVFLGENAQGKTNL